MSDRKSSADVITGALAFVAAVSLNELFKDTIDARYRPKLEERDILKEEEIMEMDISEEEKNKKLNKRHTQVNEMSVEKKKHTAMRVGYTILFVIFIIGMIWVIYEISDAAQASWYKNSNQADPIYNTDVRVI